MIHPGSSYGGTRIVAAQLGRSAASKAPAPTQAHGSLLARLRAIAPDPATMTGEQFRWAAQVIARQIVTDQPTPLDAA